MSSEDYTIDTFGVGGDEPDSPDLEAMSEDIVERFWELYVMWCDQHKTHPTMSDFMVWYEDKYV